MYLLALKSFKFSSRFSALATFLTIVFLSPLVKAGTIRHDTSDSYYQNLAHKFPSVGYLSGKNTTKAWACSGTLIAQRYVLTAAHCVDNDEGWMNQGTFWLGEQPHSVSQIGIHRDWLSTNRDLVDGVDLAILRLASSVTNVAPAQLYTEGNEDLQQGEYVGFGRTGNGETGDQLNSGTKRAGENIIEIATKLGYNNRLLFSDFDDPRLSPAETLEYQLAPGDSGGGLFIDNRLAGVNSFIVARDGNNDSDYGDFSVAVRTSSWYDWILGASNYLTDVSPTYEQALAPSRKGYNWFDDRYFVETVFSDVDFEQYANNIEPEEETENTEDTDKLEVEKSPDNKVDVPEPGMTLGLLSLVAIAGRMVKGNKK